MLGFFAHCFPPLERRPAASVLENPRQQSSPSGATTPAAGTGPRQLHSRLPRAFRYVAAFPFAVVAGLLALLLWGLAWLTEGLADIVAGILPPELPKQPPSDGVFPDAGGPGAAQWPGRTVRGDCPLPGTHANRGPERQVRAIDWRREGGTAQIIPLHAGVDIRQAKSMSPGNGCDNTDPTGHARPRLVSDEPGGRAS